MGGGGQQAGRGRVVLACGPAMLQQARPCLHDVRRSARSGCNIVQMPLPPQALDAAKGMLALHAHSPPIIHRDLKGPNLVGLNKFGVNNVVGRSQFGSDSAAGCGSLQGGKGAGGRGGNAFGMGSNGSGA